jgi:hypothetical protein
MRAIALSVVAVVVAVAALAAGQQNPYLGRWNLTGTGPDSNNVYWLEIKDEGGQLTGMFLNRVGNPNPLGQVKVENGELIFNERGRGNALGQEYRAKLEDGKLIGKHAVVQGGRGRRGGAAADPNAPPPPPPTERTINWVGVRPPAWPKADASAKHTYGDPVVLFDGTSLDAFTAQNGGPIERWSIVDGIAVNEYPNGRQIASKQKFYNFKLNAEYKVAETSNSGIYMRGRYELQILDDATLENGRPDFGHMAIYGRTPPRVKASKPAGEWQTMEAILVENRVTVTLNGQRVHDNQEIEGITGGALDNNELTPGPLVIQGDHRQVFIRKLVVTPIK